MRFPSISFITCNRCRRMMLDADPIGRSGNRLACHSNDPHWDRIPLLVSGRILHGSFAAPPHPRAYPFWVVNHDKADSAKVVVVPRKRSSSLRIEDDQGKKLPRREGETASGSAAPGEAAVAPRRNPPRGQVVRKLKDVVIEVPDGEDDDELFDDDVVFDESGDGTETNEVVEDEVITPGVRGDGGGSAGESGLQLVKVTSRPRTESTSSVHTSFTLSGAFCDSLDAMTLAKLSFMTDEEIIAAVPLYPEIESSGVESPKGGYRLSSTRSEGVAGGSSS